MWYLYENSIWYKHDRVFVSDMLVIATYNIVFLVLRKRYLKKWRIEECKDHIETQVTINHHTYFPLHCFILLQRLLKISPLVNSLD